MTRTNPEFVTAAGLANAARLSAIAKKHDLRVDIVAQRFALEGAIRRIFTSDHASRFGVASLKGGALMFITEGVDPIYGRATTDIDLQLDGFAGSMDELAAIMRDVLAEIPAVDDGVRFDVSTLKVLGQRDGGIPGGAVTCVVQLGKVVVKFKADVGFYAPEHAETLEEADYPSLLDGHLSPVRIWRQPIEYGIADKIHAAVQHGEGNTRLRDYYDIFVGAGRGLDADKLRAALITSWPLYGRDGLPPVIDDIGAFSDGFARASAEAWDQMRAQARWAVPVPDLETVCRTIRVAIGPVLADINNPLEYAA
ncbi:MAG: nucleotidyl transferase AbiEii/AbiGii toxin family protein [Devosia indica]